MNNNRNTNKNNVKIIRKDKREEINLFTKNFFKGGIIFITILIIVFAYIIFNYDKLVNIFDDETKILIDKEIKFTRKYEEKMTIGQFLGNRQYLINPGKGIGMSINWDMYIPNTLGNKGWTSNYNELKPILLFGESPLIYFHPKKNQIFINIKYRVHEQYFEYEQIKIDVKLQKWNNYFLTFNNREVYVYINGNLEVIKILNNVPIITTNEDKFIQIGEKYNNLIGKINNLIIYFKYFSPKEVLNL